MNAADRRRFTPVLGVIAGVLVLLLVALWIGLGRGAHWNDNAAPPKLPSAGATLPAPVVPPLDQYSEVWQHPLFSATRTPEAASGKAGYSGDLELTGVILLPDLKMAILHDKTTNKDYRVVEGRSSRDGPALLKLQPRSAVIDASGSRVKLELLPSASSQAGNPAVSEEPSPSPGAQATAGRSTTAGDSAKVSRPGTKHLARTLMAGLSPHERKVADQVLSGLSPKEKKEAVRAFAGLSPSQREQTIRAAMAGSLPTSVRARILKTLIEQRLRGAQQKQGGGG